MLTFFRSFFQSKVGVGLTLGFLALIAVAFAASDITGSNFGGEKKPVWVVNVRAAEEKGERVGVRKDGRSQQAAVRELTGAEGGPKLDFDTARRLFTLICVLHWKG